MRYKFRNSEQIPKENLKYIAIYTKVILNPNEVLTSDDKSFKDRIERERDYDELQLLREICMMKVPSLSQQKANATNEGKNMLLYVFPQWWGWYNNNNNPNSSPTSENISAITQNEQANSLEDEFLNALADSVENNSLLKRDAVFGKFKFALKKGTMDICSGLDAIPKLQFQFQDLLLDVESRPRSGSHFVGLSLGSILLKDRITNNSEFPDLIKPQNKEETILARQRVGQKKMAVLLESIPLFQLQYERKPLGYDTDYRLLVKSQSLDIVYNTEALNWLIDFLCKPHKMSEAKMKIEDMKNKTKKELMKNWESILEGHLNARKTWMLELDIYAPQIIFAENFSDRTNSSLVVIDFGRLQLSNGKKSIVSSDEKSNVTGELKMVDKFVV